MNTTDTKTDFDKAPPVPTSDYDRSIICYCPGYSEMFRLCHAMLLSRLSDDAQLLIAGAGSGAEILEMAPSNPKWQFTALDPSKEMLSIAREKINQLHIKNAIEYHDCYLSDYSEQKEFDAATSILVMHFLKNDGSKLEYLKQIHGRLKKSGCLILIDGVGDPKSREMNDILAAWKQYPRLHEENPETIESAFKDIILQKLHFVPEKRMMELFHLAGFTKVSRFHTAFLYNGYVMEKN